MKTIKFEHNGKLHNLGFEDKEHPRTSHEIYNDAWHKERGEHDMEKWFRRHATEDDVRKILKHFHHDLPFINEHEYKGDDPDGLIKKPIDYHKHGILERHPEYNDILKDARHYLPDHLGDYGDEEHYDDMHDRFLDHAHAHAHEAAGKAVEDRMEKEPIRKRRRFQLKPTDEQMKKLEESGLDKYFGQYPSMGHVDYDLPANGDLRVQDMQTDMDKSPYRKVRERAEEMHRNGEITGRHMDDMLRNTIESHNPDHHDFIKDLLFEGHDPKEVLRAAFDRHMKNYGVRGEEGVFQGESLRKDDEEKTPEDAVRVFKEIMGEGVPESQDELKAFIEKYQQHPESADIEKSSVKALESNMPENMAPWTAAYLKHTPPAISKQLMEVIKNKSTLFEDPLFHKLLAQEMPHMPDDALHVAINSLGTDGFSEEGLNHVVPRVLDMEDNDSKKTYLKELLTNPHINEKHIKKMLDQGHDFAMWHNEAPKDAKEKFMEKADPQQIFKAYADNTEHFSDEDYKKLLEDPRFNTEENQHFKRSMISSGQGERPLEMLYPHMTDEQKKAHVSGYPQEIVGTHWAVPFTVDAAKSDDNYFKSEMSKLLTDHFRDMVDGYGRGVGLPQDFANEALKLMTSTESHRSREAMKKFLDVHHDHLTPDQKEQIANVPFHLGTAARHDSPWGDEIREDILKNPHDHTPDAIGHAVSGMSEKQASRYVAPFQQAAAGGDIEGFMQQHFPTAISPQTPHGVRMIADPDFNEENEQGAPGKMKYSWLVNDVPAEFGQGMEGPYAVEAKTPKWFDTVEDAKNHASQVFGEGVDRGMMHNIVHSLLGNKHIQGKLDVPEMIEMLHDSGINFNHLIYEDILHDMDDEQLEALADHDKTQGDYVSDLGHRHPLSGFRDEMRRQLQDRGFVNSEDMVTMRHDTAKLREIRDKIEETGGEVPKREIERMGYNLSALGLVDKITPQGKLSAESVQQAINELPKHTYGVDHTQFGTNTKDGQAEYHYADESDVEHEESPNDDDYEAAREDAEEAYSIEQYFKDHGDYEDIDPNDEHWQQYLTGEREDWEMDNPHHDPDYHHWAKQLADKASSDGDSTRGRYDKMYDDDDYLGTNTADPTVDPVWNQEFDHLPGKKSEKKKKFEEFKKLAQQIPDTPDASHVDYQDFADAWAPKISIAPDHVPHSYHEVFGRGINQEDHPDYEKHVKKAQDTHAANENLWDYDRVADGYREHLDEDVSDRAWDRFHDRQGSNESDRNLADQEQRHNYDHSDVFQLNWTNKHVKQMKEAGVYGTFQKFANNSKTDDSIHPEGPNTIGWVRYTKGDDGFHIDEIQSPLGQDFHKSRAKQRRAIEQGNLAPADAEKHKEQLAHMDKINEILFGGTTKHPNNVIHDAFHQYLRDQGHTGKKVHIFQLPEAQEKGGHRRDQPAAHMRETYDKWPKKQGGYKPAKYGEIQTQYGDRWKGKNTWGKVLRKMEELKEKIDGHNT